MKINRENYGRKHLVKIVLISISYFNNKVLVHGIACKKISPLTYSCAVNVRSIYKNLGSKPTPDQPGQPRNRTTLHINLSLNSKRLFRFIVMLKSTKTKVNGALEACISVLTYDGHNKKEMKFPTTNKEFGHRIISYAKK